MALDHEQTHVRQALLKFATGEPLNMGSVEELEAYTEGFTSHFLDLVRINNNPPSFEIADTFTPLFQNYAGANQAAKDKAFNDIRTFFEVRIQPIAENMQKFRVWLQAVQNTRPANDALINRINALPGLGLARGTNPINHVPAAPGP